MRELKDDVAALKRMILKSMLRWADEDWDGDPDEALNHQDDAGKYAHWLRLALRKSGEFIEEEENK